MAGVVTSVLTDKELDYLIYWLEWGSGTNMLDWDTSAQALLAKLTAWRRSLECTGGRCDG